MIGDETQISATRLHTSSLRLKLRASLMEIDLLGAESERVSAPCVSVRAALNGRQRGSCFWQDLPFLARRAEGLVFHSQAGGVEIDGFGKVPAGEDDVVQGFDGERGHF